MSPLTRFEAGTVVAGLYRIVRPLSEGGMGSVYVAEQVSTRKERALKLMRPELVNSEKMRERFAQEAHVGSRIESEHVVEVIDAGIDQASGVPWLAMELLKGRTLAQACEAGTVMTVPAVRELFAQLCHAIAAAHEAGIIHRDLKPENIFLATARREGVPYTLKVLDFGIAKLMSEATTRATAAMGTPLFMPPEQMTPGQSITPAADVWALGLIAFLALTGKHYWHAGNAESSSAMMLLNEVTNLPIVAASQRAAELGCTVVLPPGFDAWFGRCVARKIEDRFRDARAMRSALDQLLGGPLSPAGRTGEPASELTSGPAARGASSPAADASAMKRLETGPTQHATPIDQVARGADRLRPTPTGRAYSGWVIAAGVVTASFALGVVMLGGNSLTSAEKGKSSRRDDGELSRATSQSSSHAASTRSREPEEELARPALSARPLAQTTVASASATALPVASALRPVASSPPIGKPAPAPTLRATPQDPIGR